MTAAVPEPGMAGELFISRAATVVSLQQLLDDEPAPKLSLPAIALMPDQPVVAVAEGGLLPLVSFAALPGIQAKRVRSFGDLMVVPDVDDPSAWLSGSSDNEEVLDARVPSPPGSTAGAGSLLDTVVLAQWEDRAEQGLFRYDVTACPTKVVPGAFGFIAQFNEGRGSKKRPTEFCVDKVVQPFDAKKFNFTKALQREVLFQFEAHAGGGSAEYEPAAPAGPSPNLVFINVSPIEYGHVLLVPRALSDLPQVVDTPALLLALQFCHQADNPFFRLAFNSLGAYGTINHLHFQAYYLAAPFAVERAPTVALRGLKRRRGVHVSALSQYPVRGLVFEAGEALADLAAVVGDACARLTAANVPHNLFVVDCGQRLFLFPNAFALAKAQGRVPEDLLATQVDPAAFEISGHIIFKRGEDYEAASQASVWRLLSHASLSEEDFLATARLALDF